ncbi:unnamed protein product, partial [Polarella glacialis]
ACHFSEMADDEKKLFIAKLPEDIYEEEMRIVFNTYGKVEEVILLDGSRCRPGQRAGFVIYETAAAARSALQVLNDVYRFREEAPEPIHVSIARPRGAKGGGKDGGSYDQGHNSRGGDSYSRNDHGGRSDRYGKGDGYGRADSYGKGGHDKGGYQGNDRGKGGYDGGGKGGYDGGGKGGYDGGYGKGYDSGKGHEQRDRGHGGKDRDAGGKGGGKPDGGAPGTKIYVGNLPTDISKEAIEQVFGTYGPLEDVHVMTGRSKSGQAAAFVRYRSNGEARNAIAAMETGYEIRPGEGNLLVKLADGDAGKGGGGGGGGGGRYQPY